MKNYHVQVTNQFFVAFEELLLRKSAYSPTHAVSFRDAIIDAVDSLHTLPGASKPLKQNRRALIVANHLLTFVILDDTATVIVIDIIDPKEDTKAKRYM